MSDVNEIEDRYAPDSLIRELSNPSRCTEALYHFTKIEMEGVQFLIDAVNKALHDIIVALDIKASIKFAFVATVKAPFKSLKYDKNLYVIIIGWKFLYWLHVLCVRLQHAPVMHDYLGLDRRTEFPDYSGKYLIDICRDIMKDEDRFAEAMLQLCCGLATETAISLIINHEVAHIAHGHVDFINSEDFSEFKNCAESENLTFRTLEMDADSSSITTTFSIIGKKIGNAVDAEPQFKKAYLSAHYARRMIFGIYASIIFQDSIANSHNPIKHPPGYARFLIFYSLLKNDIQSQEECFWDLPDKLREKLAETFTELSGELGSLGHPMMSNALASGDSDEFTPTYDPFVADFMWSIHLEPLNGRWARIRPFLVPRLKGGLLAPPSTDPY